MDNNVKRALASVGDTPPSHTKIHESRSPDGDGQAVLAEGVCAETSAPVPATPAGAGSEPADSHSSIRAVGDTPPQREPRP